MRQPITEIATLTETEKRYRTWERIEEMNIVNPIEPAKQWRNVLDAKWKMLTLTGGSR